MIDSMFQEGTDQALDDLVRRPRPDIPPQEGPEFSILKAARGLPRGVASGAAKSMAFASEVTGAFGEVAGATGYTGSGQGMFSTGTEEERKQRNEAQAKLAERGGPEFSNEAGDLFRQRSKDLMPDPTTTHASEQVIAGVAEFATQAVGYTLMAGAPGAALLGGDVALAEADKLKQQGVDLSTRTKAGAVAGFTAAGSVLLPVAVPGSALKTAAAVAVGGPGSFVAQNVAERAILQNAGYDKIASQYDPFDPVGLALSTIVPAAFGAHAVVRGGRPAPAALSPIQTVVRQMESANRQFGKNGEILEGPATKYGTAKGDMQVIDATATDPGYGVRPADAKIMKSGTKQQKADELSRVGRDYIEALVQEYKGDNAKALAAYNWGPGKVNKAVAKAGENWRSLLPAETASYVQRGTEMLRDQRIGATAGTDGVAAARTRQTAAVVDSYRLTPDSDIVGANKHQQAMERAHDQMAAGEPVRVDDLVRPASPLDDLLRMTEDEYIARINPSGAVREFDGPMPASELQHLLPTGQIVSESLDNGRTLRVVESDQVPGAMFATVDDKVVGYMAAEDGGRTGLFVADEFRRNGVGEALSTAYRSRDPFAPAGSLSAGGERVARKVFRKLQEQAREQAPAAKTQRTAAAVAEVQATRQDVAVESSTAGPAGPDMARTEPDTARAEANPEAQAKALETRTTQAIEANPDLMVQLDGMDAPVRADDLIERIKAEAADDVEASGLLDVAANCFLAQQ